MSVEALLVLCTCPAEAVADEIATALLERRLAACVNRIARVESMYRWEGKIERDQEHLLLIKTTAAAYHRVEELIVEMHPYDVPEVIAVSVDRGSIRYLDWLADSVDWGDAEHPAGTGWRNGSRR